MPPKPSTTSLRGRSRELATRTWGTRFDTLSSASAPSPPSSPLTALPTAVAATRRQTPSPSPVDSPTPTATETLGRELFAAPGTGKDTPTERRSWADDEVPASFFGSSPATPSCAPTNEVERRSQEHPKMPHNASVFVGRYIFQLLRYFRIITHNSCIVYLQMKMKRR